MLTKTPTKRGQLQIPQLQPDMQELDPRSWELVCSVAAPPSASPTLGAMGPTQQAAGRPMAGRHRTQPPTPEWAGDPKGGRWHFAEEIELAKDLAQWAFCMRSATCETFSVQQQWQDLDALANQY